MRFRLAAVLLLLAFAPLAVQIHAQSVLPGTDIRSWATANISGRLTLAGIWSPLETTAQIVPFWNVMKLGADQREGVVLAGWTYNGSFQSTLPDVTPTRAAVFEQQGDGTLTEATARLFGDSTTDGTGDVLVADFNRDGRDDVLLPAHNESPFFAKSSIAYISQPEGLRKITLPDSVMAHHTSLYTINGEPRAIAQSFGGSGNNGRGAGYTVVYQWTGTTFSATNVGEIGGMSVAVGPLTNNGDMWMVAGDHASGLGRTYSPTNTQITTAFKFNNQNAMLPAMPLPKPYFNDKPEYAEFRSQWDPDSKTHTPLLKTADLNQDGLLDIIGFATIWASGAGHQRGALQLMLNRGNMVFADDTDALTPEFNKLATIDYSTRLFDVDGSGIETWFLAPGSVLQVPADETSQGQYILMNDGTGRLYAAMHDEFRAMRTQITSFAAAWVSGAGVGPGFTPQFIAYRTPNGAINFVAAIRAAVDGRVARVLVNVPLQINLTTDFRRDLTIPTRNNSRRIRTFAGNDTIHRAVSDPDCQIDGGLGTNVAVYPGPRTNWTVTRDGDRVTVRPAQGAGGTDTLTRIQVARFSDGDVSLQP